MKAKNKNEITKALVEKLRGESAKSGSGAWKAVARDLSRPRRIRFEVNLSRIEKYARPKETLVVPGVVLGTGQIKKHVNVAAVRFSGSAKAKIEKAGGTCSSIEEFHEKNPKGRNMRIMG
jgi:large subunit ribosomal protein L18e